MGDHQEGSLFVRKKEDSKVHNIHRASERNNIIHAIKSSLRRKRKNMKRE